MTRKGMRVGSPLESSLRCLCVCALVNRRIISQRKNDEILPKVLLHLYVDYRHEKKSEGNRLHELANKSCTKNERLAYE